MSSRSVGLPRVEVVVEGVIETGKMSHGKAGGPEGTGGC